VHFFCFLSVSCKHSYAHEKSITCGDQPRLSLSVYFYHSRVTQELCGRLRAPFLLLLCMAYGGFALCATSILKILRCSSFFPSFTTNKQMPKPAYSKLRSPFLLLIYVA